MKMKTKLERWKLLFMMLTVVAVAILAVSCSDDEDTQTVPQLTTGTATIAGTTITVAGEITNAGGSTIINRGFVYSSTSTTPTLADNFTEVEASGNAFTGELTGLTSSTTYHIRAYAINSKGAGYGNVVTVATQNAAPTATNVSITGDVEVNGEITVTYTYSDAEGDLESGTIIKLYTATTATGTGEALLAEGTPPFSYTIPEAAQAKYLSAGVIVKAATGTTTGSEARSTWVGAVGEATTVSFIYNEQPVTYGIINSTATGRKWLDRNLGAPNTPTAHNDYANYGDLFQWGRRTDGHQLIVRNGLDDADMIAVNGATSVNGQPPFLTSSSDTPAHTLFIVNGNTPDDWRDPQNDNLWQGVSGTNNPCPSGWRIPTSAEWLAENLGSLTDSYSKLNITLTGLRASDSGNIFQSAALGLYWSSTITTVATGTRVSIMMINSSGANALSFAKANGHGCRCIKE